MKSPILQLIEQLERTVPSVKNGTAIDKNFWLQMEKEGLCHFWVDGNKKGWEMTTDWEEDAENYFDAKFEDNAVQLTKQS
jgi:hypothetical protein